MTVRGVRCRAKALVDNPHGMTLHAVGPDRVEGLAQVWPNARARKEGWTQPRDVLATWTSAGWACECTPRQPGPCPHVLALRGLVAALNPEHPAATADPWNR